MDIFLIIIIPELFVVFQSIHPAACPWVISISVMIYSSFFFPLPLQVLIL
jgi:hypothetical protein